MATLMNMMVYTLAAPHYRRGRRHNGRIDQYYALQTSPPLRPSEASNEGHEATAFEDAFSYS